MLHFDNWSWIAAVLAGCSLRARLVKHGNNKTKLYCTKMAICDAFSMQVNREGRHPKYRHPFRQFLDKWSQHGSHAPLVFRERGLRFVGLEASAERRVLEGPVVGRSRTPGGPPAQGSAISRALPETREAYVDVIQLHGVRFSRRVRCRRRARC